MPAYIVVNVEKVKDPDKLKEYGQQVSDYTDKWGGKPIASSPNPEVLEGSVNAARTLILEFPSMENMRGWYDSDEYKPMLALRQEAIDATLWIVDGSDG